MPRLSPRPSRDMTTIWLAGSIILIATSGFVPLAKCPQCRGTGIFWLFGEPPEDPPDWRDMICKPCSGTGRMSPLKRLMWHPHPGPEACTDCSGTGLEPKSQNKPDPPPFESLCKSCAGTGRKTCPDCRGSGIVGEWHDRRERPPKEAWCKTCSG